MDKKIIHIETTRRYVNGILVVLVFCYLYIFIFHSFSFIFWSGAFVLLGVLFGVRLYLSKKETTSRRDIVAAQKAMRDVAQSLSLEYHEHGAPHYRPLFESTELVQREDGDSALRTPQEGKDAEYFIRGKMDEQFIECFVQEAELDLGMGPVRKSYVAAETDAELVFFDIKFFITPRSQKKGIAGFIHRISQNPFAGAVDFKQLRTESQTFNYAYAIWVRRYDSQDEEMVLKILTPEFIKMTLEYKEPIYIEVAYDKIRMYHGIHNITAKKIENMLKLLAHMKNTITKRQSLHQ